MRLLLIGILLAVFASSASPSPAAFPVVGGEEEAVVWNEVAAAKDDDRKCAVADALRSQRTIVSEADSIMERVRFFAPFYDGLVNDYRANLYVKGEVDIERKNFLLRFLPSMFRLRKGERQYLIENSSDLHYCAPDLYDQKITASTGTVNKLWNADGQLPEYFQLRVYAPTLFDNKLISPLSADGPKYYRYLMDSIMGPEHDRSYRIRFMPRQRSYQLVGGYVVVSDRVWSLRQMRFTVRSEYYICHVLVEMGKVGEQDEFLPLQIHLDGQFHFFGNRINNRYLATFDYREVTPHDPGRQLTAQREDPYDLTASYTLRTDTNAFRRDTAYMTALRPVPLTPSEQAIYHRHYLRTDTLEQLRLQQHKKRQGVSWRQVGDVLVESNTVQFSKQDQLRFSPLLNPFMLSYSASKGVSYSHKLRYQSQLPHDRYLYISPYFGYNFKQREFYWRVNGQFDYLPAKRMGIKVEVGNGNRIYSSRILDELKDMPDKNLDFGALQLRYYQDLYGKLRHTWEVVNGVTLEATLAVHRRTEDRKKRMNALQQAGIAIGTIPVEMLGLMDTYNSFAPGLRVEWTPGLYYYMNGRRKVNLYSHYPTMAIEWERGLKGVVPHSGEYERIEVDVQHHVELRPLHDLYYRLGWGAFTKQQSIYFVDFSNFRRSNLPTGWNDDIGGVFQLLEGQWYNSSRQYLRANFTYEAPFLLMRRMYRFTQHVLNERLYLGLLTVPHLKPYIEVGYGIGTHIFDFGLFASFANWKYQRCGVKFTFELFNH